MIALAITGLCLYKWLKTDGPTSGRWAVALIVSAWYTLGYGF